MGAASIPGETPDGQRNRRWALAGVLALVPLLPIIAAVLIGSQSVRAESVPATSYQPVAPTVPASTTSHLTPLPRETGSLVAVLRHPVTMLRRPGGHTLAKLGVRTPFGSPQALWVVSRQPGWLGVISTDAGNNGVGWIPQGAVSLTHVPWEIHVSLRARQLTVLQAGSVIQRYAVAIGRPSAPTPTGRFAVTDRLQTGDPSGPYGCCILALSAQAPHAIQGWSGGNRIAIHSTPETSSIGQAVSHGCLRLSIPDGRWLLGHIPLGTPTIIRS